MTKQTEQRHRWAASRRGRLWLLRLAAVVILPSLFFLAIETGLRVAGTGYPTGFLLPVPGKPGVVADNYKFAWRFFPPAMARSPQPMVVSRVKPPRTVRLIVFGGSAAMGDPEPAYGLPRVLQVILAARFPDAEFEVLNAAVTAVNSHVVLPMVKDCRQLDADAWIVYLGNNEVHGPFGAGTVFGGSNTPLWLNRLGLALQCTKIGQLTYALLNRPTVSGSPRDWGGMEMFLEHQVRHDDPALKRVYANYRRNLTDILRQAHRAGTPVLLSTVVTNLRDSPPFVSLHRPGLAAAERMQWQAFFDAGCAAQAEGDKNAALESFARAAGIDADYAELNYRRGECLLQRHAAQAALTEFKLARDHDALRFRADTTINEIVRSVARTGGMRDVIFVDAARELAKQSTDGILGDELLHEHVHLNFTGNYRLARLFAEQLADRIRGTGQERVQPWPSEAACAARLGLTPYHLLLILREMHDRLNKPPFDRQLNHAARDAALQAQVMSLSSALTAEAAQATIVEFRQLIEAHPDDWILRKQFALLLDSVGDVAGATEQFEQITRALPHHAESFFRWGALLNRRKLWPEAERALRRALEIRPDFARAANSLGICLSHQGRYAESYEQFQAAVRWRPTFAEAYLNWGLVLANQGDPVQALEKFEAAVAADENDVAARSQLGKTYVAARNHTAALPHYQAVARLRPNDPAAHLNLGLLYLRIDGRHAEAMQQLLRTLELDPSNQYARRALTELRSPPVRE